MKRFYKEAVVTAERGIALDGRPVKTPAKAPLILPTEAMAQAVAAEWQAQGALIDPARMPFTGLANAAIDRIAPDPGRFAAGLSTYAESELLCYRAGDPPPLVARQADRWDPLLAWACARFDVAFTLVTGVMHQPQPLQTLETLGNSVRSYPAFILAALSPLVTISGSLVLALALLEGVLTPDAAFDAAFLEELWQEELWGADDLALQTRALRRADFHAAFTFNLLYQERC
jgi:chaperone required for assembly of F1-ATPase